MDTNDLAASQYHIRIRGRVLGPYTIGQLKTLRARGQFGRANEVSIDGQNWESASRIAHLFEGASARKSREMAEALEEPDLELTSGPPGRTLQPVWHYSIGEEQCGPVTLLELRGLIASNQLVMDDLVWKDGMPDWMAIRDVDELKVAAKTSTAVSPLAGGLPVAGFFCYACGSPMDVRAEVCPKCGVRGRRSGSSSKKDRVTTAVLALLLGGIGIHRFYLGQPWLGVLYLLFCWTLIPGIVALVEGIFFLCSSDAAFDQHHNQ